MEDNTSVVCTGAWATLRTEAHQTEVLGVMHQLLFHTTGTAEAVNRCADELWQRLRR